MTWLKDRLMRLEPLIKKLTGFPMLSKKSRLMASTGCLFMKQRLINCLMQVILRVKQRFSSRKCLIRALVFIVLIGDDCQWLSIGAA